MSLNNRYNANKPKNVGDSTGLGRKLFEKKGVVLRKTNKVNQGSMSQGRGKK